LVSYSILILVRPSRLFIRRGVVHRGRGVRGGFWVYRDWRSIGSRGMMKRGFVKWSMMNWCMMNWYVMNWRMMNWRMMNRRSMMKW